MVGCYSTLFLRRKRGLFIRLRRVRAKKGRARWSAAFLVAEGAGVWRPISSPILELVPDVQGEVGTLLADGERRLLEGRLCHRRAHVVRERVALDRKAEEIGVEMVVAVLVMEG